MSIKNEFNKAEVLKIKFTPPVYVKYIVPYGFLTRDRACQALFFYATRAKHVYDTHLRDPFVLEWDEDPKHDFKQLMKSVALAYGVEPEHMVRYWINIDMQFDAMKQQRVPQGDWIRFDAVPEISTADMKETKQ